MPEETGKKARGRPRLEDPTRGLTIRLPESVLAVLQKEADAQGLPLPTHIGLLLRRHTKQTASERPADPDEP
jgi:predicted DNA binding CopG/RHH family protein